MIVSWNADGLSICETTSERKILQKRNRILFPRPDCTPPLFFEMIREKLRKYNIDFFIFSTQNESSTSYLHSEFLLNVVEEIGYSRISYKSAKFENDKAFRVSIFSKSSLVQDIALSEQKIFALPLVNGSSIISYIQLGDKNICFAGVNAKNNNIESPLIEDDSIYTSYLTLSLLSLFKEIKNDAEIDKMFMFGQFDTTINNGENSWDIIYNMERTKSYAEYLNFDSMRTVLSFPPLWWFKEGINGTPNFPPSWPLLVDRPENCTRGQCFDSTERKMGWTNRLLHYSSTQDFYSKSPCVEYASTNSGGITDSQNDMIYGVYSWI